MSTAKPRFLCVWLIALAATQAQADLSTGTPQALPPSTRAHNTLQPSSTSGDNTLRRINPNTRQGTAPLAPPMRGPSTVPRVRQPSIENGDVGNGYPRNRPLPETLKPTAPSLHRGGGR